ncbi:MAG: Lon protease [Candidatus Tyloplasma litorale]|nr:MAG: Lon protease [Mycoplasmatales bacterium]
MKTQELPILHLRRKIVLPGNIKEIEIQNPRSISLIKESIEKYDKKIIISTNDLSFLQKDSNKKLFGIRTKILKFNDEDGKLTIWFEGIDRVLLNKISKLENKIWIAEYSNFEIENGDEKLISKVRKILTSQIQHVEELPFEIDNDTVNELKTLSDSLFIDRFASLLPLSNKDLSPLISDITISERFLHVIKKLTEITENSLEPEVKEAKGDVQKRVNNKIHKQQKEFYLREQIKAAQAELDELTGEGDEIESLRKKVNTNKYPEHIKKKALSEIRRLEQTPSQAQEANITRQYIETLLDIPYWQKDEEKVNISKAEKILNKDHYGLEKPKSKIIEYLAVKQQNPDAKGSILALVGPPGTGKTTMAKSIADSLGRKLIKISLGGVKDEAEIRGHRRTYIASQPGKIIQGMKKAGVINPIILLDEIDKMSADFKGDPTSAMLEVLDYEQNDKFQDHYLEEDYDLSNVTFIATANYYNDIPEPLLDRLDIVEINSYTELEKIQIFKKHLLKRVLNETKIPKSLFRWKTSAIKELIRHYTIEAGVRQLYRETNSVAKKIIVKKLKGELKENDLLITPKLINELLGSQKFDYTKIDKAPQRGAVTGLAWTQYGGDILPIEVDLYPGKGEIILTGQLKDVMKESATIALSYIRANYQKFNLSNLDTLNDMNIHIHSPDGATPKDGPSAGVTFTTALISALTGIKVSQYIGMTGEISLRGHVLPIGGLKEKSISAYRSGLKTIFIPKKNIKDLVDIPEEVKKNLEIIPVETYMEIFERIFKNEEK